MVVVPVIATQIAKFVSTHARHVITAIDPFYNPFALLASPVVILFSQPLGFFVIGALNTFMGNPQTLEAVLFFTLVALGVFLERIF